MKTVKIGGKLEASTISLGCMRISGMADKDLQTLIKTAIEGGINFFDHADIYGGGKSEEVFGKAIKAMGVKREEILIQSKCGIRNGFFDFSKEYIVESAEKALVRLGMDYMDVFLLHRPDTLMEPEEVAEAFETLKKAGKVRHFGVSNHNPAQIRLLNKYLGENNIIVNQLQFSPAVTGMIDNGLNVNMTNTPSFDHDGSVLEFCRLENITIQAWSPFQYGFFEGVFLGHEKYADLNSVINKLAGEKSVTPEAIVVAWILRHPAKMQVIPGSTNVERIKGMCKAYDFELTRQEWYEVYTSAGNVLP